MDNFTFYSPTKFVFGKEMEAQAGALVKEFGGSKVLLHFGGKSAEKSGLLGRIRNSLKEAKIDFDCPKNIKVRDRATLFNLLIGLNGYTICSGIISHELNGENIIARPLSVDDKMTVGIVSRKNVFLSRYALHYIEAIKRHCL